MLEQTSSSIGNLKEIVAHGLALIKQPASSERTRDIEAIKQSLSLALTTIDQMLQRQSQQRSNNISKAALIDHKSLMALQKEQNQLDHDYLKNITTIVNDVTAYLQPITTTETGTKVTSMPPSARDLASIDTSAFEKWLEKVAAPYKEHGAS
jgi:hypothetical protein